MSKAESADSDAPAQLFAALGDPTRLALMEALSTGAQRSMAELGEGLDLTRQGVAKHLRVLEDAGLVESRRSGRERLYTMHQERVADANRYLERVSAQWDDSIGRLKRHLSE